MLGLLLCAMLCPPRGPQGRPEIVERAGDREWICTCITLCGSRAVDPPQYREAYILESAISMSESGESGFRKGVDCRCAALHCLPFPAQRGPVPARGAGARSALRWRLLHRHYHHQDLLPPDLPGACRGFESSSLLRFRRGGRARGIPPLPALPP